jgi:hypothetical protein
MQAGLYDFVMEQGGVFDEYLVWNGKSLTGYLAKMSLRKNKNDTAAVFTLVTGTPAVGQGQITITSGTGNIRLYAIADLTRALTFDRCFYDLELASDGTDPHTSDVTVRLLEGTVILNKEASKA